jgi:hypothetical protein
VAHFATPSDNEAPASLESGVANGTGQSRRLRGLHKFASFLTVFSSFESAQSVKSAAHFPQTLFVVQSPWSPALRPGTADSLITQNVRICAVVAKEGSVAGALEHVLASHPRLHTAEGHFYRDVFRDACSIPVRLIPPSSLDASKVGKLAPPPWGKDQKLAALAAWTTMQS